MKNNKAFTLVELIAAVTIMGILLFVVVPNITNTLEKNKKTTYVNDAKKLITLAKKKYKEDTTIKEANSTDCLVFNLSDLKGKDISSGPNSGKYHESKSYVTIKYVGGKYIYGVQLVESYSDKPVMYRGIPYISDSSNLNLKSVSKASANERAYTNSNELSYSASTSCRQVYYAYTPPINTPIPSGVKEGDTLTIYYVKGKNIESIHTTGNDSCIAGADLSCSRTLPGIDPKEGYNSVGWSTSSNANTGYAPGTNINLNRKSITYYANAIDNIMPQISLGMEQDLIFTDTKEIEVFIRDAGTGIASGTDIKYGFSKSKTIEPTTYKKATLNYSNGAKEISFIAREENLNGSYYLWIKPITLKDIQGNVQKNSQISNGVFNFSGSAPSCTITNGNNIKVGEETTLTLTCTDELVGMQFKKLNPSDFELSTDSASIISVSDPITITNGYKYNIDIMGNNIGTFILSLPAMWVNNNVGTGNQNSIDSNEFEIAGIEKTITYVKKDNVKSIGKIIEKCISNNNSNNCEITLPSITPKGDYAIEGWRFSDDRTGTLMKPGEEISIDRDITLYAYAIDSNPPKIVLSENGSNTYTKEKTISVEIVDNESGIKNGATIKYGFSDTNTLAPKELKTAPLDYTEGDKKISFEASSKDNAGNDFLSGNMYLWIVPESLYDMNNNELHNIIISSDTFSFDNKKPLCEFNNTSDISLGGTSTITLSCTDEHSGLKEVELVNSDFTLSDNIVINSVGKPVKTSTGYDYDIVITGKKSGIAKLSLNENKIKDKVGNSNLITESEEISVKAKSYTIQYKKGDNVEKIEKTTEVCSITSEETNTCTVVMPKITPKRGYSVSGWYTPDNSQVIMPGSNFIVSENITLTAKAMDDIPPLGVSLFNYDVDTSFCEYPDRIKFTLMDVGSGLASGIKVKYGFSDSLTFEPNNYTTINLDYKGKDNFISFDIMTNDLGVGQYMWVVPINYQDIEGNKSEEIFIVQEFNCSEIPPRLSGIGGKHEKGK